MAGASAAHNAALSEYGLALGEAFQLRDDVLGVFGDSATTGKPAGDDLRERKQTVLLALALADPTCGTRISELLARETLTTDNITELQTLVAHSGAIDTVEQMISDGVDRALSAIADFPPESKEALTTLAVMSTRREA
mgnify:FL=1